ncbi:hypothetical protein PIB30_032782 [Stylosanthes scabra]|uniref:Uncharacterized protein n=1 Tax=Stylosanthes scabra TaxID=79078 RepID=A0ABU6VBP0_9FABA|nr:hypothetical protein [Stylosanthes scabra]
MPASNVMASRTMPLRHGRWGMQNDRWLNQHNTTLLLYRCARYGRRKVRGSGCASIINGNASVRKGEALFRRRLQLTARPSPLLAAVLPWDCERRFESRKRKKEVAVSGVVSGESMVKRLSRYIMERHC